MFCHILLCCLFAHVFIKLGYWFWNSVSCFFHNRERGLSLILAILPYPCCISILASLLPSQRSLHCRHSSSPGRCGSTLIGKKLTLSWMGFVMGSNLASAIPNSSSQPRRTNHWLTNTHRLLMSTWLVRCLGAGCLAGLTSLPYSASK